MALLVFIMFIGLFLETESVDIETTSDSESSDDGSIFETKLAPGPEKSCPTGYSYQLGKCRERKNN